jgi:hypothetical protein
VALMAGGEPFVHAAASSPATTTAAAYFICRQEG